MNKLSRIFFTLIGLYVAICFAQTATAIAKDYRRYQAENKVIEEINLSLASPVYDLCTLGKCQEENTPLELASND